MLLRLICYLWLYALKRYFHRCFTVHMLYEHAWNPDFSRITLDLSWTKLHRCLMVTLLSSVTHKVMLYLIGYMRCLLTWSLNWTAEVDSNKVNLLEYCTSVSVRYLSTSFFGKCFTSWNMKALKFTSFGLKLSRCYLKIDRFHHLKVLFGCELRQYLLRFILSHLKQCFCLYIFFTFWATSTDIPLSAYDNGGPLVDVIVFLHVFL